MLIAGPSKAGISTHTLTWSVTPFLPVLSVTLRISTHTLTWSVTCIAAFFKAVKDISTHTLTWSVTHFNFDLDNRL